MKNLFLLFAVVCLFSCAQEEEAGCWEITETHYDATSNVAVESEVVEKQCGLTESEIADMVDERNAMAKENDGAIRYRYSYNKSYT